MSDHRQSTEPLLVSLYAFLLVRKKACPSPWACVSWGQVCQNKASIRNMKGHASGLESPD
eukprot:3708493-Amphidinium_carterae.1